jgi:hypothetical protein
MRSLLRAALSSASGHSSAISVSRLALALLLHR